MPVIEKYEPGMFCWIELTTSDAAAAKSFYTSVFGWKINDLPIPDGSVYTMLQVDGHDLGALYENKQHPPAWNSYVNVNNVDESTQRAQENGANVTMQPTDVMDVGRMAVIADRRAHRFACGRRARPSVRRFAATTTRSAGMS